MMNSDEELIKRFMQTNRHEIADNGFSDRVSRQLPIRAQRWSEQLSMAGTVLCILWLWLADGFQTIGSALNESLIYLSYQIVMSGISLQAWILAATVLLLLGIQHTGIAKE